MTGDLSFNPHSSYIMHVDLNSCFATIEQQANPHLRGKPIAVAAYTTPNGCILAPSVEAKRFGIKTGMRVKDGRAIYPGLIILPSDPWKYRNVHQRLRNLISKYTYDFEPKSIDEFVLNMKNFIKIRSGASCMADIAGDIKKRIKQDIGEWLTVSVGIAPNRYLAKVAAGLHKPDGLDEINKDNYLNIYSALKLTDLTGIKAANAVRLNSMEIYSVMDFYRSPLWKLKAAFESVNGYYWYARLRGIEVDDTPFGRKSYGNSTALGKTLSSTAELSPVLARLVEKMASRLRHAGYKAGGIRLAIIYKDGSFWHEGRLTGRELFDSRDFFKAAFRLLITANPKKAVRDIAVSCFALVKNKNLQLGLFENVGKKERLTRASDAVNTKWGDFTVGLARSMDAKSAVLDRIAFGGIKELEELVLDNRN